MTAFILSVGISLGVLLGVLVIVWRGYSLWWAYGLLAIEVVFVFLLEGSSLLAFQAIFTAIATVCCRGLGASPTVVLSSATAAFVFSHAIYFSDRLPALLKIARMRREFPLESISHRLAFEKRSSESLVQYEPRTRTQVLSPAVNERLETAERDMLTKREVGIVRYRWSVPVAYVSENLPRMDELQNAPTRPLDEFERQSLRRLRTDEDVVVDDAPSRIRMLGSLRAAKDCLACHSGPRGALLGALSYELLPTQLRQ